MRPKILNRQGELEPNGWYQIEVSGEHPAGAGRRQVIDLAGMRAIVNRFQELAGAEHFAGMLIDNDHLSHDLDKSTEAYGWLQEVAIRNGQLWGRIEWTDLGETAIRNKRLKFFSTEYNPPFTDLGDGRVRPMELSGLALTNRPNNRGGRPITNRDRRDAGVTLKKDPPSQGAADNQKQTQNMKAIAEKLGLSADASEGEILEAIGKLQNDTKEVEELRNRETQRAVDGILEEHKARIPENMRDKWRAELIRNREGALELLRGLPEIGKAKKTPAEPLHNRKTAKSPDGLPVKSDDPTDPKEATQAEAIRNRADELKASNPGRPWPRCWDQARREAEVTAG